MPGAGKKRGKKVTPKKKSENNDNVTINDYANSPSGLQGKLKKATLTCSTNPAASCKGVNDACDDLTEIQEDSKVKGTKPRRRTKLKILSEQNEGTDYPLDLWFLISEYIEPEAVGKFASICKSSYHVVKTAKFWYHIYKRYYKEDAVLPARLRPDSMIRPDGLRVCVIRALHLMYFSTEQKMATSRYLQQQEEPHTLVSRRCCLMWHKKGKIRWYFYFKMKDITKSRFSTFRGDANWKNDGKSDFSNSLENVSANAEDGDIKWPPENNEKLTCLCRIVKQQYATSQNPKKEMRADLRILACCILLLNYATQVSCLKYGMVPLVMGLTLQTVKVTLSPSFDHHRVQLSFGTSYIPKTPTQVIVLNGVVDFKVLDWWHPLYPHHDVISSAILDETTESWDFVPSEYLTV